MKCSSRSMTPRTWAGSNRYTGRRAQGGWQEPCGKSRHKRPRPRTQRLQADRVSEHAAQAGPPDEPRSYLPYGPAHLREDLLELRHLDGGGQRADAQARQGELTLRVEAQRTARDQQEPRARLGEIAQPERVEGHIAVRATIRGR